jgi:hypothetical protein
MLAILLLGIGGLALVGAAPAACLTRPTADVKAALVLPLGAAIIVCSSTFAVLGVPVRVVGVGLGVAGALAIVIVRRRIWALAPRLAVPAVIALIALSLTSIPAISNQSWDAASAGNADPYIWVSESHAFLDGPAPAPSTEHPDRDVYEQVTKHNNPFGMAFSLSLLSLASARGPETVYSAFAALVDLVLALSVFALARLALEWTQTRSAVAALLVAGNAYLLFATFFGWQAQLLLTCFGLLALAGTYTALARGPAPGFVFLGAVGAAAGVCAYGLPFAPFLLLLAFISIAYRLLHRDAGARRRVTRSVGAIALFTFVLAGIPIVRSLLMADSIVNTATSTSLWAKAQIGLPSESLGLVPRITWLERTSGAWTLLSLLVAVPLLLAGFASARRQPGKAVLVWGSAVSLATIVALGLFDPNPYPSMKVAGYVAPLLTLTVVAVRPMSFRLVSRVSGAVAVGLAGVMFLLSAVVVETHAARFDLHSKAMAGLAHAMRRIPANARVEIDVDDGWHQSWAVYYLRERRVVIRHPQYFISSAVASAQRSSKGPVQFVLGRRATGPVIWHGAGLILSATGR